MTERSGVDPGEIPETDDEIEEIAELSNTALLEAKARRARLRQEAASALGGR